MTTKKTIALILIVLALGVLGYWVASGSHMFTQTQVLVEKQTTDELFGQTTTTQEWHDEFRPGLEYVGPTAAVLLIAAGWLFWSASRAKRKMATA